MRSYEAYFTTRYKRDAQGNNNDTRNLPCTATLLTGKSLYVLVKRQTMIDRVLGMNVKGEATVRAVRRLCSKGLGHRGDGSFIVHGVERRR